MDRGARAAIRLRCRADRLPASHAIHVGDRQAPAVAGVSGEDRGIDRRGYQEMGVGTVMRMTWRERLADWISGGAYDMPRFSVSENRRRAAQEYRDEAELQCMRAMRGEK